MRRVGNPTATDAGQAVLATYDAQLRHQRDLRPATHRHSRADVRRRFGDRLAQRMGHDSLDVTSSDVVSTRQDLPEAETVARAWGRARQGTRRAASPVAHRRPD